VLKSAESVVFTDFKT